VLNIFVLLQLLGIPDYVIQDVLFLTPSILIIWFLFGCLLGRFITNRKIALGIWLGVKILMIVVSSTSRII
jgi:hypothetical protein